MSPTVAFLVSTVVFSGAAAVVTLLTARIVRAHVRVKRNFLWWYLNGEIDREKDPVSYWFLAGQLIIFLDAIPLLILLTLSQNLYRAMIQ